MLIHAKRSKSGHLSPKVRKNEDSTVGLKGQKIC